MSDPEYDTSFSCASQIEKEDLLDRLLLDTRTPARVFHVVRSNVFVTTCEAYGMYTNFISIESKPIDGSDFSHTICHVLPLRDLTTFATHHPMPDQRSDGSGDVVLRSEMYNVLPWLIKQYQSLPLAHLLDTFASLWDEYKTRDRAAQWIFTNVCNGITMEVAHAYAKRALGILKLFPDGVDVGFSDPASMRKSVTCAARHYECHGSRVYDGDDLRMTLSVHGYNPFRSRIRYETNDGWKWVQSQFSVHNLAGKSYFQDVSCDDVVVNISKFPEPHEVMLSTFGGAKWISYDPSIRDHPGFLENQWLPNRVIRECLDNYAHSLNLGNHIEGRSVPVRLDPVRKSFIADTIRYWDDLRDEAHTCCLIFQWIADTVNAYFGLFWCDPVVARVKAANLVLTGKLRTATYCDFASVPFATAKLLLPHSLHTAL